MKRTLLLTLAGLLIALLAFSCGQKAEEDTTKEPPAVKGAEMLDSTRMDSAETGAGAYDSVFEDSGTMNEQ